MITRQMIEDKIALWLDAEEAVASSQSYKIGSRTLTYANLAEIRKQIEYWESRLDGLGKPRTRRVVPREL